MNWLLFAVLLVAAVMLAARFFFAVPVRVQGRSMLDTLQNGDILLMRRTRDFHRRDIVICHYPNRYRGKRRLLRQNFVKRVIGLPGETIEVMDGVIYVSGSPIRERYISPNRFTRRQNLPPRVLGPDEYYVMGDNRDQSNDSRAVGPIPAGMMVGRVYWHGRLPGLDAPVQLKQRLHKLKRGTAVRPRPIAHQHTKNL